MKVAAQLSDRTSKDKALILIGCSIVLSGISVLAIASPTRAENIGLQDIEGDWLQVQIADVEFGVTSLLNGTPVQSPFPLENGYNGAYVFGNPVEGPWTGVAQTFNVASSRTLQSIDLRVGRFGNKIPSGQFEVAVYRFTSLSWSPSEKLAAVSANAADYFFDILSVPVSSFDFSDFNIPLNPAEVYALAVTPTATFRGGHLTLQAATDIYPGGSAFIRESAEYPPLVPEPCTLSLMLGLMWPVLRR